ncbi:MAG TPA: superoxide dismutase [Allosphingosinicella sp.]|nr:superoxide dismutase [Allosphingosinicella sp.]
MLRAQSAQARAPFSVPPLPYAYDALAPVIDARTMEIHHGRHHRAYVDNLNRIVGDTPALRGMGLDALVARAGSLPAAVRNNAGGHWNHSFFWESMTAPDRGGAPDGALLSAIRGAFGSLDAMKTAFDAAGTSRFGSGWAWLILGRDGRLAVASTSNQDNPLMDVAETKGVPLLGNDLWEHAYYLTYQNRRGDYLREWWRVVDWSVVSRRLDQAGI